MVWDCVSTSSGKEKKNLIYPKSLSEYLIKKIENKLWMPMPIEFFIHYFVEGVHFKLKNTEFNDKLKCFPLRIR